MKEILAASLIKARLCQIGAVTRFLVATSVAEFANICDMFVAFAHGYIVHCKNSKT